MTATKTALPLITLPDHVERGALVMHNGKPYVITDVSRIAEPFTKRPALAARIDAETSIIFLILTCAVCGEAVAIKQSAAMAEVEWLEFRWKGEYRWLCPTDARPITSSLGDDDHSSFGDSDA